MFGFGPEQHQEKVALEGQTRLSMLEARCVDLEMRLHGYEQALVHTLNLLQMHMAQTQANDAHLHEDFKKLVAYVMSPRKAINGEGLDLN